MTSKQLVARLRSTLDDELPLPGAGNTSHRHRRLLQIGREDLSLARLAEAGRRQQRGPIYGVWASEKPGQELEFRPSATGGTISGTKMFCSGAGLVDRALITVKGTKPLLVDVNLQRYADHIQIDTSSWKTPAFTETQTATVTFNDLPISHDDFVCGPGWYLDRPGFWHGACGPAACWAGGAAGLVDFAMNQRRTDPHTLAHLGAMHALLWSLEATLDQAGQQIDADPSNVANAHARALTVRHLIEQSCTEILTRLGRAFGPHPLAMDAPIARRCQELELYLRQSHAERDLESLGQAVRSFNSPSEATPQ